MREFIITAIVALAAAKAKAEAEGKYNNPKDTKIKVRGKIFNKGRDFVH